MNNVPVGIVGIGVYLPDNYMTAKEISEAKMCIRDSSERVMRPPGGVKESAL